ncbi:GNAT family N-acetyltransferase [Ostreiculturibacter nitratireducens]|uniref:GNAT family N-acetyltransferase n=1 Tax=Ostreiculturibacter nitratireducens TaxID=3075226 RepID=UPI0031B5DD2B
MDWQASRPEGDGRRHDKPSEVAFTLNSGFFDADRADIAELYWQAFGGKLDRVMGPADKAKCFIRAVASPRHAISARAPDGTLLGVAGFRSGEGALVSGGFADLRAVYGYWGAIWRRGLLSLLLREVDNGRFLVDGIAVRAEARGHGVGTALVGALCREAQARGYGEIRLDVVAENIRARSLYERLGFVTVRTERSRLMAALFGFSDAVTMVRKP